MIDPKEILQNETVQNLLKKFGVSQEQANSVSATAVHSIKTKFAKEPKKVTSLLSENKNTEEDEKIATDLESDFFEGLTKKIGLSPAVANGIKTAMPSILNQVSGKLSSEGKNSEQGILSSITDFFDGDNNKTGKENKTNSGGLLGMLKRFFFK